MNIEEVLNHIEAFGFSGGKLADSYQRIVEIAAKDFIDTMEEMGNGRDEAKAALIEAIKNLK